MCFCLKGEPVALEPQTDILWQYGCTGLVQQKDGVLAYFPERVDLPLEGTWAQADETNYLEKYYAELKPVVLSKLVIAPTHSPVTLRAGQRALWLDPGMAFGSGHHETTRLALEALEKLELFGLEVLDVGAGSGILTIAADLLGARSARGLDIDEATLPIAKSNARLNLSRAQFDFGTLTPEQPAAETDVLVANLYAELHERLFDAYARALRPGGTLILTGILKEKLDLLTAKVPLTFGDITQVCEGDWALLRVTKS